MSDEYITKLYSKFPESGNFTDLCCYWFRMTHDQLMPNGRAGLVGTNMIRKGENRKASLDYIKNRGGFIYNAISDQKWSGDANVHVSIVNWSKKKQPCFLDGLSVEKINTLLRSGDDIGEVRTIRANKGFSFIGVQPTGKGFEIAEQVAREWIASDKLNTGVLSPYLTASDLTSRPQARPSNWIIDFNEMTLEDSEKFHLPYAHVVANVKPQRMKVRRDIVRRNWWKLQERRPAMRRAIKACGGMMLIPCHSKWFVPISSKLGVLPNNSITVIASSDSYVQGVVSSGLHRAWVSAMASTLKGDTRYTPSSVFETFPFPQQATAEQAEAIRQKMIELNDYRNAWMVEQQKGITEMYNRYFDEPASKLRKLHDALDALVLKAYGWSAKDDVLANLLDLNLELAELEAEGRAIVGPWDPSLASLDCGES